MGLRNTKSDTHESYFQKEVSEEDLKEFDPPKKIRKKRGPDLRFMKYENAPMAQSVIGKNKAHPLNKTREEIYADVDLTSVLEEIRILDWNYIISLRREPELCPYCRLRPRITKDHVISGYHRRVAKFQKIKLHKNAETIINCCASCNKKKGNLLISEWLELVKKRSQSKRAINNAIKNLNDPAVEYYTNIANTLEKMLKLK